MLSLRLNFMIFVGTAALVGIAGCISEADLPKEPAPIPKAPAKPEPAFVPKGDLKPKKADLPKLPPGAEPIDDDAPDELTPTPTGLYYRVLRKSEGRKPAATDSVVAHYKGWLDNGKQFDSSYDRGEPTSFPLNGVIPGWTEGLQLVGEGGMIELEIPPELGYGARGSGASVPPNATLHFLVELKQVK